MANTPRTSGVFSLGALGGDGALTPPSPSLPSTPVYFLDGSVSGSTATSILSGNSATLGSGVSQVTGVGPRSNDVFRFTSGSANTYIKNTSITSMYGGLPYTFTAMVKGFSSGGTLVSKNSYYAATQSDFPFSVGLSSSGQISCNLDSNDNDFSADYQLTSTGSLTSNTWTHVAVVADTSTVKIYINGALDTSGTHSVTLSSTSHAWTIGNHAAGGQTDQSAFDGDMTDIMFIDAALTAQEIANLYAAASPGAAATRPTRRWGGMTGRSLVESTAAVAGDANWSDVTLLLDGTSATSDVANQSTVSTYGTVNANQGPTGAKWLNTRYLDLPSTGHVNVTLPTGKGLGRSSTPEFTVEGWVWFDTLGDDGVFQLLPNGVLSSQYVLAADSLGLMVTSNQWKTYRAQGNANSNLGAVTNNTYYHVALTSDGTYLRWYVDGTQIDSVTVSSANIPSGGFPYLGVGGYFNQSYPMDGRIQDFRVTDGVARYSGIGTQTIPDDALLGAPVAASTNVPTTGVLTLAEHYQGKL